uniref:Uncharacterized protein n=1 Tax=Avena sativa TaxID=4498 RepID=A0ACD5WCF2_AVESA
MPSWNESETSGESLLGDICPLDYAPNHLFDEGYYVIDDDAPLVCSGHNLKPRRCVAFEGKDTGRRFYLCSVENQVMNCGFQRWIDPEWDDSLQHALSKLWGMYNDSHSSRIEERYESSKMMKALSEEKEKLEKKHATLLEEGNRWIDQTERKWIAQTEKKVIAENYAKIMSGQYDAEQMDKHIAALKNEVEVLKNAKEELKNVLKSQAQVFKVKQQKWDEERANLKDEKKKLEYSMHDLFKANAVNKDKVKRIKAICEEEE